MWKATAPLSPKKNCRNGTRKAGCRIMPSGCRAVPPTALIWFTDLCVFGAEKSVVGRKIDGFCTHLGTYGMGGPGFSGCCWIRANIWYTPHGTRHLPRCWTGGRLKCCRIRKMRRAAGFANSGRAGTNCRPCWQAAKLPNACWKSTAAPCACKKAVQRTCWNFCAKMAAWHRISMAVRVWLMKQGKWRTI